MALKSGKNATGDLRCYILLCARKAFILVHVSPTPAPLPGPTYWTDLSATQQITPDQVRLLRCFFLMNRSLGLAGCMGCGSGHTDESTAVGLVTRTDD